MHCKALRWGWVFLHRTQILSGIQTKHYNKRALYLHKRALYLSERALYLNKRDLYLSKRALPHLCQRWYSSAMTKSDFSCVETRFFPGSCHCALGLQAQVPKFCTDLDLGLLYILILGWYSKFARENNFLALGVCFPQPCSSAGRRFAASRSRVQNYRRIVSFL